MKKNRNEKRRLQMRKAATASKHEAKQNTISKKMLSVILAFVFVLTVIPTSVFMLRGKADELAGLSPVTMSVRANGANGYTTATVPAGSIEDNYEAGNIEFANTLPNGVTLEKAILVDHNANTETTIASVGAIVENSHEHIYYALENNSNTGTLLKQGQELVLVMAAQYEVDLTANEHGTVTTSALTDGEKEYVWGGNGLTIQTNPEQDYRVSSIRYSINNGTEKSATIRNDSATIPANELTGDVDINVTFSPITEYTISEVQNMSRSTYYPNWVNVDNHGGIATGVTASHHSGADPVSPGDRAVFILYSESNTGGSHFVLNMLSINGVDIAYPATVGANKTTPFHNSNIIVTLLSTDEALRWNDGDYNIFGGKAKSRTVYKIEVDNVHEDMEVAFNFKQEDDPQIIIKGLRGIDQTGYSIENQYLLDRYYTLARSNQHKYTTYYTWGDSSGSSWYPSNNLLLYTVKPGYNPYTVTTEMSYDGGPRTSSGIRDNTTAGDPETVIKNAGNAGTGRYDTSFRYWGENSSLTNRVDTYRPNVFSSATELLLTTIKKDAANDWYAVALAQNDSNDQQLYLNAIPYNYSLQLETGNGSINVANYSTASVPSVEGNVYIENDTHTVEDAQAYIVTPSEIPTWDADHVFQGWQLLDESGNEVDGKVFQNNSQVPLNKAIVSNAAGDVQDTNLRLRLRAIWQEISHADTTTVSAEVYYQTPSPAAGKEAEINGKTYETILNTTETQPVGEETALLNTYAPEAMKYYELNPASRLKTTPVNQDTASVIPEVNQFKAIYDLKLYDFTLKKELFGRTKYNSFSISLKLTRPNDYPLSVADAKQLIEIADSSGVTDTVDNNTIIYTKTFSNNDTIDFSGIPYGWTYEVIETERESDDSSTTITAILASGKRVSQEGKAFEGTVSENTDLVVTNQKQNDDPNIVSDKWLEKEENGDTYKLTMETYAIGETISETMTDPVPMDIALVIDQSGSMGTKDVNPQYVSTGTQNWTVKAATSGETYYYKVGDKYYPVHAQEGTLYEAVNRDPYILQMIGRGHDGATLGVNGTPTHFNIPTSYYCKGSDGKAHKVYVITAGVFAQYYAYPYYYLDDNDPIASQPEWQNNIYWVAVFDPWDGHDFDKLREKGLGAMGGQQKEYWKTLTDAHRVNFLGQTAMNQTATRAARKNYSWITNGDAVTGLYLPKDGTNYDSLYYIDDNGNKVRIGNEVDFEDSTAYRGELYSVQGTATRLEALQEAVTDFTQKVADNAKESGADHRIAMIGFAGNKFPARSTGETAYNTTKNDYTDTGLFLNDTFKNYQTITGYRQATTQYINVHYYTTSTGGNPVYYSGGNWYYVNNGSRYTGSTFYEPIYEDLSAADYQAALVEASEKEGSDFNGVVNENLTDAIENFGHYGGTYTSYGMHMANQLFDNNTSTYTDSQGNTKQRRRLIIVFTDGEPGPNGYNSSIAGEALADGNRATYSLDDGGVGATVYTIGLFPGNASQEVQTFMEQLSSKYTVPSTNKYAAANVLDGGSRTAANNYGAGQLDPNGTYYYIDNDGKTYAVTTKKDGLSTLGWWQYSGSSYIHRYPKTASNDERTIDGQPVSTFYNSSGRAVYEEDLDPTQTYYSSSSTRDETTAIRYEYRWFNSNNSVREPKTSANGQGIQFFELGTPIQNTDGKQYYYEVKETSALTDAFATAFETIVTESSKLETRTSLIRDVISDNFTFDAIDNPHYKIELIDGTRASENDPIVFSDTAQDVTLSTDASFEDKTLTVKGFDFAANYIAKDHPGKKIRITMYGLKPTQTGGIFESNTGESGVCKLLEDEEGEITDDFKLIDAFPMPSISRYKYTIDVNGDDTTATYGTGFSILDGNGDALTNSDTLLDLMKHAVTYNEENWEPNDGVIQNTENRQQRSIILEEIRDVDQFEVELEGAQYKHGDAVPDDYQVRYTVTGTGMNDAVYDYTKKINNGATEEYKDISGSNPFTGVMLKDQDETVHISSKEKRTTVTIQEITKPADPDRDFSDPDKLFDVTIQLLDRNGDPAAGYVYGDLEFDNHGKVTIPMKHNDAKTFEIPVGYQLTIDVEEDTQDDYTDSYRENGTDKEGTSYQSGPISDFTSIQVINTNEAPVVTGFEGIDSKINPFLLAGGIVALLGGVWLSIAAKRKRQLNER